MHLSQAILSYNGAGPFKIVDNYPEATTENVMFGGADPKMRDLVRSDIEIRRNQLFKPARWRPGDPSFGGVNWPIKDLLDLKNAQRVLIEEISSRTTGWEDGSMVGGPRRSISQQHSEECLRWRGRSSGGLPDAGVPEGLPIDHNTAIPSGYSANYIEVGTTHRR
jgi:hypothetical protein